MPSDPKILRDLNWRSYCSRTVHGSIQLKAGAVTRPRTAQRELATSGCWATWQPWASTWTWQTRTTNHHPIGSRPSRLLPWALSYCAVAWKLNNIAFLKDLYQYRNYPLVKTRCMSGISGALVLLFFVGLAARGRSLEGRVTAKRGRIPGGTT